MSVAFLSREVHIMHLKESFHFIAERLMSYSAFPVQFYYVESFH